jgi:hypothetical protein
MFAPKVAKPQTKAAVSSTGKLAPQRSIGNQALLRLLAQRTSSLTGDRPRGDHEQEADPASLAARRPTPGASWDFSKIPLYPPDRWSQPQPPSPLATPPLPVATPTKLVVGQANDPLEHEADRVADQVMRMPDPAPSVSRAAPFCIAKGPTSEEEQKPVRAEPAAAAAKGGFEAPPIVHEVLRSSGQQLDALTRTFFEPRFGRDFSNVHIHDDVKAAQSARAVDASAYTVGQHIVFGAGRYQPRAQQGRNLLAHELGHVVQQSSQRGVTLQAQPADTTSQGFVPAPAPGVSPPPPPVPGSLDAVRAEAVEIGQKWGTLLADRDIALDTLQTKRGGVSVWDRMKPEEKQDFANKVQQQFTLLPILPQYDKPDLIAAQDDGFTSGVQSGFSLEKFTAFLVKLGTDLAIALFSGLVARGIRLPRFIAQALRSALPATSAAARTAAEVEALIARVRIQSGRVVYNIGGRAAPGEPAGAINVNPEELPGGIPNQVVVRGEAMDGLLPNGSGDEVFSRNLVGDINWDQMARASKAVVKPGGTVTLSPWGGQLGELPQIQAAMEKAGLKNVRVEFGAVVKGER